MGEIYNRVGSITNFESDFRSNGTQSPTRNDALNIILNGFGNSVLQLKKLFIPVTISNTGTLGQFFVLTRYTNASFSTQIGNTITFRAEGLLIEQLLTFDLFKAFGPITTSASNTSETFFFQLTRQLTYANNTTDAWSVKGAAAVSGSSVAQAIGPSKVAARRVNKTPGGTVLADLYFDANIGIELGPVQHNAGQLIAYATNGSIHRDSRIGHVSNFVTLRNRSVPGDVWQDRIEVYISSGSGLFEQKLVELAFTVKVGLNTCERPFRLQLNDSNNLPFTAEFFPILSYPANTTNAQVIVFQFQSRPRADRSYTATLQRDPDPVGDNSFDWMIASATPGATGISNVCGAHFVSGNKIGPSVPNGSDSTVSMGVNVTLGVAYPSLNAPALNVTARSIPPTLNAPTLNVTAKSKNPDQNAPALNVTNNSKRRDAPGLLVAAKSRAITRLGPVLQTQAKSGIRRFTKRLNVMALTGATDFKDAQGNTVTVVPKIMN